MPWGFDLGAEEACATSPECKRLTLGVLATQLLALVHTLNLLVHQVIDVTATVHPATGKVLEEALFPFPFDCTLISLCASSRYLVAFLLSRMEMGVMYDM
ncbi:LOW QUALITY PROTEIN: Hypothetical protein PHPALM_18510 [Phytophthora palmivora]|uniref:Uncharacterized protein n=1 Tax=Phytophthora palmivora TaxID=4796 RepID=A0A2P4XJK6_9STRA|nr:LOW QUALITY PROTEIN: Hypothetical protein PHPALM_18510 [Phytophthora palmivora]